MEVVDTRTKTISLLYFSFTRALMGIDSPLEAVCPATAVFDTSAVASFCQRLPLG